MIVKQVVVKLVLVLLCIFASGIIQSVYAQASLGLSIEGEYRGSIYMNENGEKISAKLEVKSLGNNEFKGILSYGPNDSSESYAERNELTMIGKLEDFTLKFKSEEFPYQIRYIFGRFTALNGGYNYAGHLEPVIPLISN